MPKIVKSYGVQISEDVFRIKDAARLVYAQEGERAAEQAVSGEAPPTELFEEQAERKTQPRGTGELEAEIIQGAMAEARKIIAEALEQAEHERQEQMARARSEAERTRAEAAERGRQEAYIQALAEIKAISAQIEQMVANAEGERAGFEAEYEEQLKWFAAEIASKVLAQKVDEDDAVLVEMVDKAVQGVRNEAWVKVNVAEDMQGLIARLQEIYRTAANVQIEGVQAAHGVIQLETPGGVIDASMETQLENLKSYFVQGQV